MSKVEGFIIIPQLKAIVVGSNDNMVRVFKVDFNKETGMIDA